MNTQNQLARTIIIFVALAVVCAILILAAQTLADPFIQWVMLSLGSGIFASGLTFFLLRMFSMYEKHN